MTSTPKLGKRRRVARLEQLEGRHLLSVSLQLSGTQELVASVPVNVSSDAAFHQSEMSLAVNSRNPLNIVGFTHAIEFESATEMDTFVSNDGGLNWHTHRFTSSGRIEPNTEDLTYHDDGIALGLRYDPTVVIDAATGDIYIGYGVLWGNDQNTLRVARSADGGTTWVFSTVLEATNDSSLEAKLDKWQLATGLDPNNPNGRAIYITYVYVTDTNQLQTWVAGRSFPRCPEDQWGAATCTGPNWTTVRVSDVGGDSFFPDPAVGPNGELYVTWIDRNSGQIKIDDDRDGLFCASEPDDDHFGTDLVVTGVVTALDLLELRPPAQSQRGVLNAVMMDVDLSPGEHRGRLYITYVDHRDQATANQNPPYDVDVFVLWADPQLGEGFGSWQRVSVEGSTATDFNPWLDVDQSSGSVTVIYYHSEENGGGTSSDVNVYARTSLDGGQSFGQAWVLSDQLSNASSIPPQEFQRDYLEYIGLAFPDGTLHALWAHADDPTDDMEAYYTRASFDSLTNRNTLFVRGDEHIPGTTDTISVNISSVNAAYLTVQINGQTQFAGLRATIDEIVIERLEPTDVLQYPSDSVLAQLPPIHVTPIVDVDPGEAEGFIVADGDDIINFTVTVPPGRYVRLYTGTTLRYQEQLAATQTQRTFSFTVCGRSKDIVPTENDCVDPPPPSAIKYWNGTVVGQVVKVTYAANSTGPEMAPLTPVKVGDFNRDSAITAADIDLMMDHIFSNLKNAEMDLNKDGNVTKLDLEILVNLVFRTYFGDANLSGLFNSADLVLVWQAGEYEDTTEDNSTWSEGDWNADKDFNSGDQVTAFQDGGYTEANDP